MTPQEILIRDAFLLGIELKLFWFVTLLYGISFIIGIAYLISSRADVGKTLTWGLRAAIIFHTILITQGIAINF